jgi:hypothetical protein
MQLLNIPRHMMQPANFLNEILTDNDIDQNYAIMIQKLFYGIGHPQWFRHLRDACRILRRKQDQRFPTSDGSLPQSFRLVIHWKENGLVGRILRRFGFADLVRHRNKRRGSQRVSAKVLKDMLREACPELRTAVDSGPEFKEGLGHLRTALKRGRH